MTKLNEFLNKLSNELGENRIDEIFGKRKKAPSAPSAPSSPSGLSKEDIKILQSLDPNVDIAFNLAHQVEETDLDDWEGFKQRVFDHDIKDYPQLKELSNRGWKKLHQIAVNSI